MEQRGIVMSVEKLPEAQPLYVDRQAILKALAESNAAIGFVPDYTGTIQEIRDRMVKNGVRPEDNSASREMIALRYPGEDPGNL